MFTKKTDKDGEIFGAADAANSSVPAPAAEHVPPPRPAAAAAPAPVIASRATAPMAANNASGAAPSYFGNDLFLKGDLISKGEVQIDGQVEGDVRCTSLVIGEKANIKGSILADDVVVRGHVSGSIHGVRVTLESSSQFEGEVYHKTLAIEQGAFFEGQSRRSDDPIGDATKAGKTATTTTTTASATPGSSAPAVRPGLKPGLKTTGK